MTPEKLLEKVSRILADLKIPYAITGGFALSVWGTTRYTNDIDIIVELIEKNIKPLAGKVAEIDKNIYVDEDMMRSALEHKTEFNFIEPDFGLKVDFFVLADNNYNKLKIKRAVLRDVAGTKAYFISPEDLILGKLLWSKESNSLKQREDIKNILEIQKGKLDLHYIKSWAERQGTIEILNKLLEDIKKQ